MLLRLVRFTFSGQARSRAQAIADDITPAIKQQPGCLGAYFFGGSADGESGLCVMWDSQEHANAAAEIIGPRLTACLADNVIAPFDHRLFTVIAC